MPDRNKGSNKRENQDNQSRNQGSSTPGAENRGDQTQGQNRGTTPGAQREKQSWGGQQSGSSMQGQSRGNFENKTQEELLALAKKQGVMGSANMSREELIRALNK